MTNLHIGEGKAYVDGRSPETAKKLLDAAKEAGLEGSVVRTTSFGYIVPEEIAPGGGEKPRQSAADGEDRKTANADAEDKGREARGAEDAGTGGGDTNANGAVTDGAAGGDEGQGGGEEFDPSDHNVEEVLAYLDKADDEETERVLAAERDGKARVTILESDSKGAK